MLLNDDIQGCQVVSDEFYPTIISMVQWINGWLVRKGTFYLRDFMKLHVHKNTVKGHEHFKFIYET